MLLPKHQLRVLLHGTLDATLLVAGFVFGAYYRLGWRGLLALETSWLAVAFGAVVLAACAYIAGLYSFGEERIGSVRRVLALSLAFTLAANGVVMIAYLQNNPPISPGTIMVAVAFGIVLTALHHLWVFREARIHEERVAVFSPSPTDKAEFDALWSLPGHTVNVVHLLNVDPSNGGECDETWERETQALLRSQSVDRIILGSKVKTAAVSQRLLRSARYLGIPVQSVAEYVEECYQYIPISLVSSDWLMAASSTPRSIYLRKLKRVIDIVVSGCLILLSFPVLLVAMVAVKLSSPGPVFYQQDRLGRFGRRFQVWKLRTMRVDAEAQGPVWSGQNDPRITAVGTFLRRHRIDEIPQLFTVLSGQMSIVGPRPERPEFCQELESVIPHFGERLNVQPGLTGWAQVRYPYGSSREDARRKLEFDLYYMKNMSVLLDVLILMDTIRIVLGGGVSTSNLVPAKPPQFKTPSTPISKDVYSF